MGNNSILSCRRFDKKRELFYSIAFDPGARTEKHDEDDFFPFIEKRFSSHETTKHTIERRTRRIIQNSWFLDSNWLSIAGSKHKKKLCKNVFLFRNWLWETLESIVDDKKEPKSLRADLLRMELKIHGGQLNLLAAVFSCD